MVEVLLLQVVGQAPIEFLHKKILNGLAKKKRIKDILNIFQVM